MKGINPIATQIANSPSAKLAAKLADNPMVKAATQMANNPMVKAATRISRIAQPYAEALQNLSHIEWIGKIPKCWDIVKTKRIFQNNKQVAGKHAGDYERLALTMNGVIKRNKDDAEGLQPESFDGYQVLEQNQLVFKLIDLENVKTSRVGLSPYTGIVSPAYIVLKNTQADNRFFYYYYMNMYYQEIFNYMGGEGVRSALNAKDLLEVPLPNISIPEQQAIADYLDGECARIDGIVEKQRQIIEKLKEYKKSVITEAVTRGLNPDAPMKDSGIEWIGKIPEHWEVKKLKYICSQRNEKSTENNLKYIGLENIISFSNRYIDTNIDIEQNSTNNICKKNDILFGKLRPYLAKCVISDFDGLCSGEFLVLHQCNGSVPYYHYLMLSNWFLDVVNSSTYGTKMPRANWTFIGGLFIPVPRYQEQQEIADYLDQKCTEIDSIIEKRERMIELMTEYKKSLIYECVTGKKEIVDVVE